MKNYSSKFDQRIHESQMISKISFFPQENNISIGELYNKILSNPAFINNFGPNKNMVSSYILIRLIYINYKIIKKEFINLLNKKLFNNEINNFMSFDTYQNININNELLNNFFKTKKISKFITSDNINNQSIFGHVNEYINQKNFILNHFYKDLINVYNINTLNNCVNNNLIKNEYLLLKDLFEKTNHDNCNKNILKCEDEYIYLNNNPHFNQKYNNLISLNNNDDIYKLYDLLFYYNLSINFNNNLIKNQNNLINLNDMNNIKLNKYNKKCSNSSENSLTSILCDKKGINEIKEMIIKNPNYLELIRKILLILNKENGLHKVCGNIYGNYFFQELFSKMNNDLIQLTIDLINSEFVNIAKNPFGTHCLQKLLNFINNSEMEISILKAIKYKEKEMAFDDYATYVLQKIILIIPDKKRKRLNNLIIENAKELSLNSNSVFILKKFIATITIEENKKKLINMIKNNFLIISQNPFGNYVIQYLFETWPMKDCDLLINEIFENAIELSTKRFSSNIIIKALNIFDAYHKLQLINILCFSSNILILLKNKYGYYVIIKIIKMMDNNTKDKFELYLIQMIENISISDKILILKLNILLKK